MTRSLISANETDLSQTCCLDWLDLPKLKITVMFFTATFTNVFFVTCPCNIQRCHDHLSEFIYPHDILNNLNTALFHTKTGHKQPHPSSSNKEKKVADITLALYSKWSEI